MYLSFMVFCIFSRPKAYNHAQTVPFYPLIWVDIHILASYFSAFRMACTYCKSLAWFSQWSWATSWRMDTSCKGGEEPQQKVNVGSIERAFEASVKNQDMWTLELHCQSVILFFYASCFIPTNDMCCDILVIDSRLVVFLDTCWDSSRSGYHGITSIINSEDNRVIKIVTITRREEKNAWHMKNKWYSLGPYKNPSRKLHQYSP